MENIEGGAIIKQDLDCMIVQDLLPNYIEKLTSDVTNQAVEEHISTCEQCNVLLNIMSAEITTKKTAPKRELKFLKKIKLSRLIAAVSCILLALIFSYMLYASEYKFTSDKKVLAAAITEYTSHGRYKVADAYILETKEIDGALIAFFKDNNSPNVYGFARLLKGINMKYRLVSANYGPCAYSAIVDTYRFDTRKGAYYAVGGHNLDKRLHPMD
ncbi:MAG: zf-HC2 domain-containing protein [Lutispora sp.]|nr:zf-HC2 domain-containing protein [Lutispora sp.]MDD4834819.1 zf-HC2 domain-containing protein [Lutispora sp.]